MKKVTSGQRLNIPAEYFNNFIDASEFVKRQQNQGTPVEKSKLSADVILIKNTSNSAVDRWGVLGIGEPLITPNAGEVEFSRRIAFKGETLDADHAGKFAIAQEPIAVDAIGRAKIAGVSIAAIKLVDEDHDTVDIYQDGSGYKLMSAVGGSGQILWVDAVPVSGGLHLAVIRFGGIGGGGGDSEIKYPVLYRLKSANYSAGIAIAQKVDREGNPVGTVETFYLLGNYEEEGS